MPGNASSGSRDPYTQSRSAQSPRRGRGGHAQPNMGQYGDQHVHPVPVASGAFSFERATKTQCVGGVKYALSDQCAERDYFTPLLARAVETASQVTAAPASPLLVASAAAELQIQTIKYGQLKYVAAPDTSLRDDRAQADGYAPDSEWEMYKAPQSPKPLQMVQAPLCEGGRHYEVLNQRKLHWTVEILASVDLPSFCKDKSGEDVLPGDLLYAVHATMARRGKDHLYGQTVSRSEYCTAVSVGEINPSTYNFVSWHTVMISDSDIKYRLFYQFNKNGPHWPKWSDEQVPSQVPSETDDLIDALLEEPQDAQGRFSLVPADGKMAYKHKTSKDDAVWVSVSDFELVSLDAIYQFIEDDCGAPYAKIICRALVNRGHETVILRTEDENRCPDLSRAKFLEVEILVQMEKLRTSADLKGLFQRGHPMLNATSMTVDMLAGWIADQEKPLASSCIARFGRQPGGFFVSKNLWFDGSRFLDLESAGISIIPQYFKDALLPLPKSVSRPGALGEGGHPAEVVSPYGAPRR